MPWTITQSSVNTPTVNVETTSIIVYFTLSGSGMTLDGYSLGLYSAATGGSFLYTVASFQGSISSGEYITTNFSSVTPGTYFLSLYYKGAYGSPRIAITVTAALRSVIFNLNSGSGTTPTTITKPIGTVVTLPATTSFTRTSYIPSGWNTNTSGTGSNYYSSGSFTIASSNTTLYVRWIISGSLYAISYNVGGGSSITNQNYTAGTTASYIQIPLSTRYGYVLESYTITTNSLGSPSSVNGSTLLLPGRIHGNISISLNWVPEIIKRINLQGTQIATNTLNSSNITLENINSSDIVWQTGTISYQWVYIEAYSEQPPGIYLGQASGIDSSSVLTWLNINYSANTYALRQVIVADSGFNYYYMYESMVLYE